MIDATEPTTGSSYRGGGGETILLVDDEPSVRKVMRRVLERAGYRVLEAECGDTALALWSTHRQDIALLLTDVVMPDGLCGRDLARRMRDEAPALRVVYSSGYTPDLVQRDTALLEGRNFLQKPHTVRQVLDTVRKCLDE